jgi:hypothetical protein
MAELPPAEEFSMGYHLNTLMNLPVDEDVQFYIFLVKEPYNDEDSKKVLDNFKEIAKGLGDHAVIAQGLAEESFPDEVLRAYMGENMGRYAHMLPALLVTNDHPEQVKASTLRLFVPLATVEKRYGTWATFFRLVKNFVTGKDDEFLVKFNDHGTAIDLNKAIGIKIPLGPISVNLNEFIEWWSKRRKDAGRPAYT